MENTLSPTQTANAVEFYSKHREWVDKICKETTNSYPPTEAEDKNDPRIWKPAYWNWFKTHHDVR